VHSKANAFFYFWSTANSPEWYSELKFHFKRQNFESKKDDSSINDDNQILNNENENFESAFEYESRVNSSDLCENEIFEDQSIQSSYEEDNCLILRKRELKLRISESSESESSRLFKRVSPILRNLSPLVIESNLRDDIIITYPYNDFKRTFLIFWNEITNKFSNF
jgi:hypothetical protein